MTELTAMTMAADVPQHWKTAGPIRKESQRLPIKRKNDGRTNQANPTAFSHQETTATARINRPIALPRRAVRTRSMLPT
ncbi:hypothetical protein ABIF90_008256 [Bradyrhizobium japonicum]